ncbi:hypothetical protein GGS23DRAFT_285098 [Durotheca rogersii]|uniref:uncharacterized protein n=1 Tax=Durotheca rogersii TaxID=419775 RepID=UPI002220B1FC|nr:uncharacterized protein GGS23DRAFT_285098 [Durotheca rogersii]KAI5866733.1 hypothetical protein GGS23DRAFT_285098 [Durotheca rogersii]
MTLWPFRRKGSRTHSKTPGPDSDAETSRRGRQEKPPLRSQTEPYTTVTISGPVGANRDGPAKLRRRPRTYSFSPGRQDSLRVAKGKKGPVSSMPPSAIPAAAAQGRRNHVPPTGSNEDAAIRVPTLHHDNSGNKRRGQPLPRKKSSKRRKEDHAREAEIKAMSQFMPVRPATDFWTAGRPMKKESKRIRAGFNRGSCDEPSDISLPVLSSIHSAMSSDSEHLSWKVSALDALAPRPTLRCSTNPIYGPVAAAALTRSQSTRRKLMDRGTIPEATLKAHKRVDNLADDLDSADLRQLMERDQRRRERKKEKERERVERRLARRAERQRAEEAAAAKSGTPPPQNLERGVLGRESIIAGCDPASVVVTSSRMRSSNDSNRRQDSQQDEPDVRGDSPKPLEEFHRTDSIPLEPATPAQDVDAKCKAAPAVGGPPSTRSLSPKILNFIQPRKSRSKSPKSSVRARSEFETPSPSRAKPEDADSSQRTSGSGSSRSWKLFFKWGKNKRGSGPSSFSNTSRDSMSAGPPPVHTNYIQARRMNSNIPKRTMSRFREDLPELPLSPPDSRVASPEADPLPVDPLPAIPDDVQMRYDTPNSGHRSHEAMRATPISWHRDEAQPSPAPQSMSLASIDSEASWLSGRIGRNRASSGMRNSVQQHTQPAIPGGSEGRPSYDQNIVEDEYMNSVVPTQSHRKSTGEARPSSDEDYENEAKWGSVDHIPTVTHHTDTMRSREGLLLQSLDDDDDEKGASRNSDDAEDHSPVQPQKAMSVSLAKGHARNFSAGSAKLLEISPRASGENQRGLLEHGTQ